MERHSRKSRYSHSWCRNWGYILWSWKVSEREKPFYQSHRCGTFGKSCPIRCFFCSPCTSCFPFFLFIYSTISNDEHISKADARVHTKFKVLARGLYQKIPVLKLLMKLRLFLLRKLWHMHKDL